MLTLKPGSNNTRADVSPAEHCHWFGTYISIIPSHAVLTMTTSSDPHAHPLVNNILSAGILRPRRGPIFMSEDRIRIWVLLLCSARFSTITNYFLFCTHSTTRPIAPSNEIAIAVQRWESSEQLYTWVGELHGTGNCICSCVSHALSVIDCFSSIRTFKINLKRHIVEVAKATRSHSRKEDVRTSLWTLYSEQTTQMWPPSSAPYDTNRVIKQSSIINDITRQ